MSTNSSLPSGSDPKNSENDNQENEPSPVEVRPPIQPFRDILVENDLSNLHYLLRNRKRRHHSVFDGVEEFPEESQHQEFPAEENETSKKIRLLEDLFRPPFDLMYRGTFNAAREMGQTNLRWLMVNIQNNREFACHVLNRDVWSNQSVKSLIKKYFTFWQVNNDSPDGMRYIQFYKPVTYPYVAVIDPRTGEKLIVWHNIDAKTFSELVDIFLKEYGFPSVTLTDNELDTIDAKGSYETNDEGENEGILSCDEGENDEFYYESDPDETSSSDDSQKDKVSFTDEGDNSINVTFTDYLGDGNDPMTNLVLRFPDGKRENICWPCTSKIKAVVLYTEALGYNIKDHDLLTIYPRRNLCQLDLNKTLKDIDLFPREIITVHEKS